MHSIYITSLFTYISYSSLEFYLPLFDNNAKLNNIYLHRDAKIRDKLRVYLENKSQCLIPIFLQIFAGGECYLNFC